MKVTDILRFARERGEPVFSFEFFPPRTDEGVKGLFETVERLRPLGPAFVSVTYGAGGSTRQRTIELVTRLKRELEVEAVAHLTCVGASRQELAGVLDELLQAGVHNVLALRGDPPRGQARFEPHPEGFRYASELVAFIRSEPRWTFCLGAAAYPEGHPETRDPALELDHLRAKVAAGADFLVTQLFFDDADYFRFVERARAAGIATPILPGIMPFTSVDQVERFTAMCGARIPALLRGGDGGAPERPGRGAPAGRGLRHAPVRRPAPPRRAGHPLLHAQPLARDPRHPGRAARQRALAVITRAGARGGDRRGPRCRSACPPRR